MLIRVLAIILVIFHTRLLNTAMSDHIQHYKQSLMLKAAKRQTAEEQCGAVSLNAPAARQYLQAAMPGKYTRLPGLYLKSVLNTGCRSGEYSSDRSSVPGMCDESDGQKKHADNSLLIANGLQLSSYPESWVSGIQEKNVEGLPHRSNQRTHSKMKEALESSYVDNSAKFLSLKMTDSSSKASESASVMTELQSQWTVMERRGSSSSAKRVRRSPVKFTSEGNKHTGEGNEDYSGEVEGKNRPAAELLHAKIHNVPPKWMTALYFSQREQLKVNPAAGVELPRSSFTLELWVKPEGGQNNPALIAGVFDNCSSHSEKGWRVGIRTSKPMGKKDSCFFFTLRTDRAKRSTTVAGHQHYQPSAWTHVVARYDGHRMALFIDGTKVRESTQQSGDLYSPFIKSCRTFLLGGNLSNPEQGFRGYLGGVVLWDHARSRNELFKSDMWRSEKQNPLLELWADFSMMEQQWVPYKNSQHPAIVVLPAPEQELISPFLPPTCGVTVCDNPDVILSYNQNWELRAPKRLRYRVVNMCNDDGSSPTVSEEQILSQKQALEEAFGPYNLTLELSIFKVYNSSLRRRLVLSNCHVTKVGDRHCDRECDHPLTGHDGGDCLRPSTCYSWMRGDGVCQPECNTIYYDYDDGDCCDPEVTDVTRTCFDPESSERAYLSVKELKELLHLNSSDTLNVFFSKSAQEELAGAATWPWAKEALTHQGGMILNPSYFGTFGHNNTMIHEMGHIFGLYHVFKGVSERESCDDPCQETTASMETGDFCADTAPTPKSKACKDPGLVNDTCGSMHYHNTPYNNYMSYTDDNCTNHFTPNQVARMHCYVDLVYKNWVQDRKPTPIPLPSVVIGQDDDSVSIHWLHPLSGPLMQREEGVNCQLCDEHGALHQYAHKATSPHSCDSSGYWTPEEAVGAPDVYQPCEPSMHSWSPEFSLYEANMSSQCLQTGGCVLQLYFQHAVVPDTLTVWITYISFSNQAISDLEFILETGESVHAGPQNVFCDIPLTLRATSNKKVKAVKLSTFDKKLEVDAVLLTSQPQNPLCSVCRPLIYHVLRDPPIQEGRGSVTLKQSRYTDSDVQKGMQYEYRIQVEAEGLRSELSPSLVYIHGEPSCGDGQLQGVEECDDGNLLDRDGCSKKCSMEPGFNCVGQPSHCYFYEGDGVCEEFEKGFSLQDCGFFTPNGFIDQWASSATASHQDWRCPALSATGEPNLSLMCRSQYVEMNDALMQDAWVPCTVLTAQPVWLRVEFEQPGVAASILIYLADDGEMQNTGEQCKKTVSIQLCDTSNKNHTLGTYELSCQHNPLVVNVTHDLSIPFFQTAALLLNFSTVHVAVLGVALRTSCHFSPLALTGCVHRPCTVDSCSAVKVEHASVSCTPILDPTHCSITCHRGYTMHLLNGLGLHPQQRVVELRCVNGAWDHVVSCEPVDCGLPDNSHVYFASFTCPWGTTFGKQCTFSCNSPSTLQGESNTLACLEDGLWSFPEAYCKIECLDPPAVPNAKLLVPQCNGRRHGIGTVCRYKCNPGYYAMGALTKKPRKRFLKLECLEGGRWQTGGCSPISCPALPAMFEGMYTCTNHLDYDSVCTLHCPVPTERYSIRCTKDGQWTEDFSMCKMMGGLCQAPLELNMVEYTCDEGYGIGAVCYPVCILPLSDPVLLPNNSTADALKHWILPTRVQSIVCTGTMKWHPNPEQIRCIQSCEPFGGDGWCDTINNRAYCQYDGGDCCPSTLSTKKVIQFGADCDLDECTCRDPEAEENKGRMGEFEAQGP
ncbi:pappalysin-2 isoform X1 [Neoarius graeffei]|uniref:pappalysin-2 isoform X1 n=1 Tax=Neoarius graeffei TaxID=443677 RepID=UPI00298D2258|nr:pappalysin-2 isoform X1 [Neoarius graeffei]